MPTHREYRLQSDAQQYADPLVKLWTYSGPKF